MLRSGTTTRRTRYSEDEFGQLSMFGATVSRRTSRPRAPKPTPAASITVRPRSTKPLTKLGLTATAKYAGEDPRDNLPISDRLMIDWTTIAQCNSRAKSNPKLDVYDYEVLDAVCSLVSSRKVITADMIYRVMVGKQEYMKISAGQRESIADSLFKCASTYFDVDIQKLAGLGEQGARELRTKGVTPGRHCESFIKFGINTFTRDTVEVESYQIEAPIADLAEKYGWVAQVPLAIFDTPPNKSKQVIMLQANLLRKIFDMYRRGVSWYLDIEKILEASGISNTVTSQEVYRRRQQVEAIMNHWMSCGFIKGYVPQRLGCKIVGYTIQPAPQAFTKAN